MKSADAGLARAQRNLEDSNLRAPFAGTIVQRDVDPGALIGADRGVLMLSDLETVAIEVGLTERELLRARGSQSATVTTASLPGFAAKGTIEGIAERADPDTGTYSVRIRVDNRSAPALLGGMVVDVEIAVGSVETALAVPEEAVLAAGSDPHLYVVESGRAQRVPVRVVARAEGVLGIEALSGLTASLAAGETGESTDVVIVGQSILRDGDAVEVVGGR